MFGRTGQMFPRPRAYHDAIYEEEYGSETEEDCCRGRGISAIVCWLLSVIVLIGVAVAVVLTVFFVLRSRSPASTLEDLTTIFDNDLTFSSSLPTSVPAAASDEVPPNSGSSSFEDDWASTSTSSSSSTRSIFANSGHSSRRPTVYVDSSEIRQGGHRNNNFKKTDIFVTHHQKPGFEEPSATTPVRESSSNTNGKLTTRRYYSDTTGQAVEDVISKTTSLPPSATTPDRTSAQSNSDERIPSASESVEAIKKHSSQYFSEESSNSFQNFPTKPPSEAHGTTLFTAAPSSGPKTTNNNKRNRVKGNTKPFVLYPNDSPNSSSEETVASSSTTEAPAESVSSEEAPQAKKIPSGFRPSNFADPTTPPSGTTRVEDMLTKIIMRNKNVGTATTRRFSQPTTTPSTLESQEEPETTRRPGKMRTVVHRTTTTTQPPNVVLVTPSSESNLIDRSSEEEPPQTTIKKQTTTTERPKVNDSSENVMDILVGSEDSKTLITKETDKGVITSAILPPWYQSDRENESPEENTKTKNQRETAPKNDHGLFRQPDLTALLDILSSSEGKSNLTSETYKNEMQTEASSKAERIKNLEDELKPVFTSGPSSDTEREGMPVRHGSAATGFHFNGAGDTKTNIYGFFPDDLEGEESSEQLHVAPAPNHMVHPQIPANKKDYDDADTSDGEDHVIDIAYDSKLNPEIQLEVEQSSEEEHSQGVLNGYGHREPLHSTEVNNPPATSMSHPDLDPPSGHQILPPFSSKAKLANTNSQAPEKNPASQETPIAEISLEAHEDDGDFGTRSEERPSTGFGGSVEETRPVMKFHNEPQHHQFGEMPSASESTNVVQAPPSSEEERYADTRKSGSDWSQKSSENHHEQPAAAKNFTQPHLAQNSLEEYSDEDPNYHYGTSVEEHFERHNSTTTTPPPTTTTTTAQPRTKIVEVFAQPYSPTRGTPTSTTPAPPQAYDDYYSNESPESNKTRGFVPPEPINFHENQHNFASPEYTSKSGWRPLTFNHRKGADQAHSNSLVTPGGQGVRAPSRPASPGGYSTRPVELLHSPQRPRPPPPDLRPPTSSEEEESPQGPPKFLRPQQQQQQQQQDNTWTGIPSANVLPNTVQKLPTRMKFPSESSAGANEAPRPTMKVPQQNQPPQPLRHRTQMHIDRNKYLQRPAVPPIIMRRLPQIQQNPIQNAQNTRGPPETPAPPSSVPPPPPPPPHSSPPVVVTVPASRRPIVQHRGPHQYLPPQRHPNQGPQQQSSPPSGSIQWPSEDHQQRQQSLLDQRIQQQQNIIRRNSQYLLNQRRHQG